VSGTFSSFSNALSALRYNRVAMDVASGNVANAGTAGYARRNAVAQSVGAPAVPAMWSRWEGAAGGVEVGGVERMVDPFLDARARQEHGSQAYLDSVAAALVRVESTLGEPGDTGIAAALSSFKQGWQDVANNPGDGAARSQLLSRADTLVAAFANQARSVESEWADQHGRLEALAVEVNDLATDLAEVNQSLRVAFNAGTDAGTLLDQRDQLSLRLSELTGASTHLEPDGTATVTVGAARLVEGDQAGALSVSGAAAYGDPVTVTVIFGGAAGTLTEPTGRGEIGAAVTLMNDTLPDYLSRLDAVAASIAEDVNAQHRAGEGLDGVSGRDFFTGTTAATLAVAVTDSEVAAAAATEGTLGGANADALGKLGLDGGYRTLITDFGSEVASARRVAKNQSVLTSQVDASREALSGVNIDEEMIALLTAQRAYEGAARVITAIDSVLDTLINRTGLLR